MALVSCTIACNLCGNTTADSIAETDRDRQALRTVLCQSCGLAWTDPRPSSERNRQFYAEEYRLQYKSAYIPKRKHVYRETLRAIARYQAIASLAQPGMKHLDVGSGAGFFPYVTTTQGLNAQGIEPNRGFATYAGDTFDVPTANAFFQDVDLAQSQFDLVTLNHVLEHVEDPCATLNQLREWLKPNGYLVVEVPNIEATYHAPQNRFHIGHLYNFNSRNLERLGEKAGLNVIESKLVPGEQHLHITFQRPSLALVGNETYSIDGNYDRVLAVLKRHTTLRHYTSKVPYLRFVSKQAQYLVEKRAVRGTTSPRDIADALIAAHLHSPGQHAA